MAEFDGAHQLVIPAHGRPLTAVEFRGLADVRRSSNGLPNISSKSTRRAYENALQDFMRFTGLAKPVSSGL